MKNKQNLHIHTTYADGKNTPEEIVLAAIEHGFDSIGFSEHSYNVYSPSPCRMNEQGMEEYKREIRALKQKYSGIIDIFCGMEVEIYSDIPMNGFDYKIGAVHYLDCGGEILGFDRNLDVTLEYVRRNFDGDGMRFAKKYFETVCTLPQKDNFDIIGHFDIHTKNNEKGKFIDTTSKEYLDMGMETIHSLKGKIPLFEVNTGGISRGYRAVPYPQMEFLKEFRRCGFGVIITSDCHDKNFIDCFYEEAEQLIAAAGFKSKWILTDSGFEEVDL